MIQISPGSFIFAALLIMLLPLDWLMSVLLAALFHEACHIVSVFLLNGRIMRLHVRFMGCTIEATGMGEWQQLISILAGPLGSLSLLLFYRFATQCAICGLIQGFFNLLPIFPLDGGRLLRILLEKFCPNYTETIMNLIAIGLCILIDILAIWLTISYSTGLWPIFLAIGWNVRMLPRKIPCKPWRIGVQ